LGEPVDTYLPYWLASVLSRALVSFVPLLLLPIPVLRGFIALFRWRASIKLRRHYRALLSLEERYVSEKDPAAREKFREEFDRLEERVNRTKVSAAFAEQYYGLRGHVSYVGGVVSRS
jgi:hypothetical protein